MVSCASSRRHFVPETGRCKSNEKAKLPCNKKRERERAEFLPNDIITPTLTATWDDNSNEKLPQ